MTRAKEKYAYMPAGTCTHPVVSILISFRFFIFFFFFILIESRRLGFCFYFALVPV